MKAAIVILIVLIVGSNAGLLGGLLPPPLSNVLDAAASSTQAQGYLSSLQNQIAQAASDATQSAINQMTAETTAYLDFETTVLTSVQAILSPDDLDNLTTQLAGVVTLLENDKNDLVSQINGVVSGLASQIQNTVNPVIQALSSNILSGSLKLSCFTNEASKIAGNISEVVSEANPALNNANKNISQSIDSFKTETLQVLNSFLTRFNACNGSNDCQTEVVSEHFF